jgi:hypothetical protein
MKIKKLTLNPQALFEHKDKQRRSLYFYLITKKSFEKSRLFLFNSVLHLSRENQQHILAF